MIGGGGRVAAVYQDPQVAQTYIQNRFATSWQRLLHQIQVERVQTVYEMASGKTLLEIAPGPARIAVDLDISSPGYMVEFSREMIIQAQNRLETAGKRHFWQIIHGNAFDLDQIHTLPEKIDFIYSFRMIRHFKYLDRQRIYRQVRSRLAPQGFFMFDLVNRSVREKLDRKAPPKDALPVYDVTYTKEGFVREMAANRFEVIQMQPVLSHFFWQSWISIKCYDIFPAAHEKIIQALEKIPSKRPLEWVALCRPRG
jgi:SAM-dependent methyltransferase